MSGTCAMNMSVEKNVLQEEKKDEGIESNISGVEAESELPSYTALAEDVSSAVDPLIWWKDHETETPEVGKCM